MSRASRLNKPHYLFRPRQLLRRLNAGRRPARNGAGEESTVLPWGYELVYKPDEVIGSSISRTGVYDLAMSEIIHRLMDHGEVGLDVGANIGYVTSILAARAGPDGRVVSLEPHPRVFTRLEENLGRWSNRGIRHVHAKRMAASDRTGAGTLLAPPHFDHNMGLATLAVGETTTLDTEHPVELVRLDDLLGATSVGVAKVDVEGHELQVFRGADALLRRQSIRDVVFEESGTYPTAVTKLLERHGYQIFQVDGRLLGPGLLAPQIPTTPSWDPPSFLATADPERAISRFGRWGWTVLKGR